MDIQTPAMNPQEAPPPLHFSKTFFLKVLLNHIHKSHTKDGGGGERASLTPRVKQSNDLQLETLRISNNYPEIKWLCIPWLISIMTSAS